MDIVHNISFIMIKTECSQITIRLPIIFTSIVSGYIGGDTFIDCSCRQ